MHRVWTISSRMKISVRLNSPNRSPIRMVCPSNMNPNRGWFLFLFQTILLHPASGSEPVRARWSWLIWTSSTSRETSVVRSISCYHRRSAECVSLVLPSGSLFRLTGRLLHISFLDQKGAILAAPSEKWDTKSRWLWCSQLRDSIIVNRSEIQSNDGWTTRFECIIKHVK